MDNPSLSESEFSFLKNLISIESTGSSPVEDPSYGTLPYGTKPFSALKIFLGSTTVSAGAKQVPKMPTSSVSYATWMLYLQATAGTPILSN